MNGMNRLLWALRARTHFVLRAACLVLVAAALPGLAPAQPAEGLKLEAIDVQTLPGQQLQLRLRLNGPAPEPLSFTIDRSNGITPSARRYLRISVTGIL